MAMNNIDHINDKPTTSSSSSVTDTTTTANIGTTTSTRKFEKDTHAQRNDTTRRVEAEVLRILSWENPIRSGVIFLITVGSVILTHQYSLLQIASAALTLVVTINLVYVGVTQFSQTVIADRSSVNPYNHILEDKDSNLLNKENAVHYSSLGVDVAETIARALTRIILIEDTMTSLKWLCIFFITWRISAYIPSRVIILIFTISAFIVPRLYISNKDLVDARLQQTQAIINTQLQRTQQFANEKLAGVKEATKSYVEKTTTTTKKVD